MGPEGLYLPAELFFIPTELVIDASPGFGDILFNLLLSLFPSHGIGLPGLSESGYTVIQEHPGLFNGLVDAGIDDSLAQFPGRIVYQ